MPSGFEGIYLRPCRVLFKSGHRDLGRLAPQCTGPHGRDFRRRHQSLSQVWQIVAFFCGVGLARRTGIRMAFLG